MSIEIPSAAQATEALIHQYSRLVFQVIYGLTGDWHESQDLTQDFVEEKIFVPINLRRWLK